MGVLMASGLSIDLLHMLGAIKQRPKGSAPVY